MSCRNYDPYDEEFDDDSDDDDAPTEYSDSDEEFIARMERRSSGGRGRFGEKQPKQRDSCGLPKSDLKRAGERRRRQNRNARKKFIFQRRTGAAPDPCTAKDFDASHQCMNDYDRLMHFSVRN